jgi:hypothetical protein
MEQVGGINVLVSNSYTTIMFVKFFVITINTRYPKLFAPLSYIMIFFQTKNVDKYICISPKKF